MRALWRSTLQEPPAKLCHTHILPISSSSVSLLLSLKSRLWPRFVNNLPWGQQSSFKGARERRSDNITGTPVPSLLSNQTENYFSDNNGFSSLWTQPKKLCQKQAYTIPALFIICSFSVFISRLCKFQVHAHRAPTSPRLQPPRAESSRTPIPSSASPTGTLLFTRKCNSLQKSLFSIKASLGNSNTFLFGYKMMSYQNPKNNKRFFSDSGCSNWKMTVEAPCCKTGNSSRLLKWFNHHSVVKCLFWLHHKLL